MSVAMVENLEAVRCDFDACGTSMVFRVVMAVVDQLCADADTDLQILEALDVPLEDALDALAPRGIEFAAVALNDDVLVIDVGLSVGDHLMDTSLFGESSEMVESFFDVRGSDAPPRVRLTAMLG